MIYFSLQYAKDHEDTIVAIVMGSWVTHLITNMWMAIQSDSDTSRLAWREFFERAFCVKILDHPAGAQQYKRIIRMETRDLFLYKHHGLLNQYVEYQAHVIRTLFRFYNNGYGINLRRKSVQNMCSVIDAMFGGGNNNMNGNDVEKESTAVANMVYSVIHSRSLEGDPGIRLLARIAKNSGCDPMAALDMEPEYIKAILAPLGMLDKPIVFITDHQRPEILQRLLDDPDIGPNIHLVPDEASWIGGDITVATMADVFIGNPASSFSGFIAKSRVALGYDTNYLFRKRVYDKETKKDTWVDVCDSRCIFNEKVMNAMA